MTETFRNHRYNPCKGCPDRYPACSDHCKKPEYLEYREEQKKIRDARAAYKSPCWTSPEMNPSSYRDSKKRK